MMSSFKRKPEIGFKSLEGRVSIHFVQEKLPIYDVVITNDLCDGVSTKPVLLKNLKIESHVAGALIVAKMIDLVVSIYYSDDELVAVIPDGQPCICATRFELERDYLFRSMS